MKVDVRYVTTRLGVYLRAEDVVNLLREHAGSEETDVRKRLEELAASLQPKKG